MRNQTKTMIRKALMDRLNKEPLSKITVRALCEDCGINHNTFYYYYADIYAIIQEYFQENMEHVKAAYDETASWEKSFLVAAQPALDNKVALDHIYHSIRKEDLENYIYSVSGDIMIRFVNSIYPQLDARQEDRLLIAHFFRCALTSIVLHWIDGGMKEKPEYIINRIGFLMDGSIEEALRRSADEKKKIEKNSDK
ncbi:MAG: TetR family transcriptional regulator C-terminal domain-containing protein [Erysipelotrichaceae bacterium]|nr:TetR family transcriptional regulator C-terminal domain-containing protein [Erysipelotrichaceae bacterium]MCI1326029.1 TetR family transcriptional regulator C-terminal domain-containing protein [Solobacterium sp.]MCH4043376.1 TetR family transcriptional regulator C-terminal domain-containing protein [Erysipelotrichaceae bacterium]MCH4120599.1 TetR family transcriptional regulator C-terminal domain-containing protein [Erysipelotrichaceae bacterium]MCI1362751.1 TetR family transcriptional regu